MVSRAELVRGFVLNSICDDYGNLAEIADMVGRNGSDCGIKIERPEIERALRELVEGGLAKAYRLYSSTQPPEEFLGMPGAWDLEDRRVYFWITPEGAQLHSAECEWWPFDEENNLRKDWKAPED